MRSKSWCNLRKRSITSYSDFTIFSFQPNKLHQETVNDTFKDKKILKKQEGLGGSESID